MLQFLQMTNERPGRADARVVVDQLLAEAVGMGASDVHIEPTAGGTEVRFRVDGLLQAVAQYESDTGRSLATRLMVLARLLTYRPDIPQEGRATIAVAGRERPLDIRISMMPTTHGPRAAVRLPAELIQPHKLEELSLPQGVVAGLKQFAGSDSGMLIVTGPAGSGKTTTVYALLAYIAESSPGLSIVTLEDPVERDLPGVTQIEVTPFGERTYERALRSLLRQDPQVLMLGEIRDAATASLAVQAALSGHRMICTLHAAGPGGAVARLLEMGVEPYQITSSLAGIVAQRLVRRSVGRANVLGGGAGGGPLTPTLSPLTPALSPEYRGEGGMPDAIAPGAIGERKYRGRVPIAEFVTMNAAARGAILGRADADTLQREFAGQAGYRSLRESASDLVSRQVTDSAEVDRVLGTASLEGR